MTNQELKVRRWVRRRVKKNSRRAARFANALLPQLMTPNRRWFQFDTTARDNAAMDALIFGTGVYHVAEDGTETHIPIDQVVIRP